MTPAQLAEALKRDLRLPGELGLTPAQHLARLTELVLALAEAK